MADKSESCAHDLRPTTSRRTSWNRDLFNWLKRKSIDVAWNGRNASPLHSIISSYCPNNSPLTVGGEKHLEGRASRLSAQNTTPLTTFHETTTPPTSLSLKNRQLASAQLHVVLSGTFLRPVANLSTRLSRVMDTNGLWLTLAKGFHLFFSNRSFFTFVFLAWRNEYKWYFLWKFQAFSLNSNFNNLSKSG